MRHHHDIIAELREPTRELRATIPGSWKARGARHEEAPTCGAPQGPRTGAALDEYSDAESVGGTPGDADGG